MNPRLIILLCVVAAACGWTLGAWRQANSTSGTDGSAEAATNGVTAKSARRSPKPRPIQKHKVEAIAQAMAKAADGEKQPQARSYGKADPEHFLAWILGTKPPPSEDVLLSFFASWARADREAAFEAAFALPRSFGGERNSNEYSKKQKILTRMLGEVLEDDWRTGLAWVDRVQAAGGTLGGHNEWLQKPSQEMAEAIAKLPYGNDPNLASTIILDNFTTSFLKKDFEAAREWALKLDPHTGRWAQGAMFTEWAKRDMEGMLNYLAFEASSSVRQHQADTVLFYARSNPKAALLWTETHLQVPGASSPVLETWMMNNQTDATEHVLALEDPQQREAYLRTLADSRSDRGPSQEFYNWIEPFDAENRGLVLEQVTEKFVVWSRDERRDSFLNFVLALPDEEISDTLLQNIGHGLMRKQGWSGAFSWAASLPGGRSVRATENIVAKIADKDPAQARSEVAKLPAGPAREAAERVLHRVGEE